MEWMAMVTKQSGNKNEFGNSRLVIETGEQKGMIFSLCDAVISIGRGPDNIIQVIDSHMSRNHSLVIYNEGYWFARDLGSKNGTLVNNKPIPRDHKLEHGDKLMIGETVFVFEHDVDAFNSDETLSGMKVLDDEREVEPNQMMKLREQLGDDAEITGFFEDSKLQDPSLMVLYRINDAISSILNINELLEELIELIQRYFTPDRAGILLYDERYQLLLPKAVRRAKDQNEEIVISNSIIKRAISDQSAVLVSDAPKDFRFKASDSIVKQRIRSALCAPLIYKNEILGVIYLDRRQLSGAFIVQDLKLVTIIANQAAQAIANSRLHGQIVENRAQEREIEIARSIQENLLPKSMPILPNFEIAGFSHPANMVGGDYFDVIPLGDGRYVLAIADVSGKGVPAAILLSGVRAAVQIEVRELVKNPIPMVMDRLNQMVCRDTSNNMFVTMLLGVLDPQQRTFTYTNAGHVHPILFYQNGTMDTLEQGGCFLGVMPGAVYEEAFVTIPPESLLIMYSDGVTDMLNEKNEMFNQERLIRFILDHANQSAKNFCRKLEEKTQTFRGTADLFDDFTALVLKAK